MGTLPPPFRLIALERVDSTNDEARRAAERGEGHGTVVWAAEQTAGRGRRGRAWVSPAGNLHCSLLLDPGQVAADAAQLTFVAAVAVRDALAELAPAAGFAVKWPNDILADGRKMVGMLLERAEPWVIVGIGVNLAHAPDPALYPATSLRQKGSDAAPFDVLVGLCGQLAGWYDRWRQEGFAPIRQAWLDRAIGVGGPVTVRLSDGTTLDGRFADLDAAGALMLETAGGVRRIMAGDVFFR